MLFIVFSDGGRLVVYDEFGPYETQAQCEMRLHIGAATFTTRDVKAIDGQCIKQDAEPAESIPS